MTKILGILGFGIVGKSALRFVRAHSHELELIFFNSDQDSFAIVVADSRHLTDDEHAMCASYNASVVSLKTTSLDEFFATCDAVMVSPGIDISTQKEKFSKKIIHELDLFALLFKKPVIALTGTLGKTTTTQLLDELLLLDSCQLQRESLSIQNQPSFCGHAAGCSRHRHITGGNIGYGMLDALMHQENVELALLELSSFQLEENKNFAPKVGIFMNISANHLDRHKTMRAYFEAKWNLFKHQTSTDSALIGIDLIEDFETELEAHLPLLQSQVYFVSDKSLTMAQKKFLMRHKASAYFVESNQICLFKDDQITLLMTIPSILLEFGFLSNWIFAFATMHILGKNLTWFEDSLLSIAYQNVLTKIGAHRLELCATINGVDFYNDSKATVIEATQAALKKCLQRNRPLLVILGGLSKGADRLPLLEFIKAQSGIKKVISFGPGGKEFPGIENYETLQAAMNHIFACVKPGDQVLFSPSGASYDLFNNYEHRGTVFKELVAKQY